MLSASSCINQWWLSIERYLISELLTFHFTWKKKKWYNFLLYLLSFKKQFFQPYEKINFVPLRLIPHDNITIVLVSFAVVVVVVTNLSLVSCVFHDLDCNYFHLNPCDYPSHHLLNPHLLFPHYNHGNIEERSPKLDAASFKTALSKTKGGLIELCTVL